MPLNIRVQDIEEVPEDLRDSYEQDGDEWVLKFDTIKDHPGVQKVKGTTDKIDKEKRDLSRRLKAAEDRIKNLPEDFDPDAYAEAMAELEELRKKSSGGDPDDNRKDVPSRVKMLEQKIERLTKEHGDALGEKDQRIQRLDGSLRRVLIDDGLNRALLEAGVDAKFMKAAKAMLRDSVSLVEEDESYRAVVETDSGEVELAKYVADWAASDDGKHFIAAPTGSGADAGKGKGEPQGNPFKKDTANLTEQSRMVRDDPTKAKRLMRAAGWSDKKVREYLGE